jgi:hypothetical protein
VLAVAVLAHHLVFKLFLFTKYGVLLDPLFDPDRLGRHATHVPLTCVWQASSGPPRALSSTWGNEWVGDGGGGWLSCYEHRLGARPIRRTFRLKGGEPVLLLFDDARQGRRSFRTRDVFEISMG